MSSVYFTLKQAESDEQYYATKQYHKPRWKHERRNGDMVHILTCDCGYMVILEREDNRWYPNRNRKQSERCPLANNKTLVGS